LVIFLCLLASAFFAGLEIAFLTSNKLRIELERNQGYFPARILSYFVKQPSKFIATTLVGNNVALVIYGIFMAALLEPIFHRWIHSEFLVLLVQVLVSTVFVVITAEFLPKALFRINPNQALNWLALPFFLLYIILFPIVFISITLSETVLSKLLKIRLKESEVVFGRVDLDSYVRQFTNQKERKNDVDHEIEIFQNALDFSSVKIREAMIPRTEVVCVQQDEPVESLLDMFVQTKLSKILVYGRDVDDLVGYVHSSELFKRPKTLKEILRPIAHLPETMPAQEALALLRKDRSSIAVVVDEFGGTAGLITVEDLMEEIFGEIEDEHDKEEQVEKQMPDGSFLFSARLEVDYLNNRYKLGLPLDESYETLAGLYLHYLESFPEEGQEVVLNAHNLRAVKLMGNRILEIRVHPLD